ncbi:7,8-dihydropterin-6-methyl-4-(beta-D-ribofuranosyl)-aminobenzene-5'-phosphate synthase [Candidatus Lokiarchaeum ossiferum]|uniref:7, 8-dihydropterin-6-methyl-4-(Beta-D-ribofuranosyl)-aminobenzene-5'-phosphate synthase n=1 Tax=Candidatus Lokiarchaeum ossiferum TaxID=2951803 RepID=A0ABY6HYC2_9ARCH|nr:7,8-dihydropterin-6-methyl-4-(beta-D-ribofuranosyl)-aminobenzene-5'-phosphate synthase [Candidatus Lokiarchaeum sp. B-35]
MDSIPKITILYENNPHPKNSVLENGHGFAALIKFEGKTILFDAGWNGSALLRNCETLGISLKSLDAIFLSHAHWDHIGGMPQVLEVADNPIIYYPDVFSKVQPKEWAIMVLTPNIHRIKSFETLNDLSSNIATTGCIAVHDYLGEQAILLRYNDVKDGILIVGCLHPGLKPFLEAAASFCNVTHVIGGIHGFNDVEFLNSSSIRHLHVGHCTQYSQLFENLPNITLSQLYVGKKIKIDK